MADFKINITELIRTGWNTFKANIGAFIGILAVMWVINMVPNVLNSFFKGNNVMQFIINIVFMVPQIIISIGAIKYVLELVSTGEKPAFSELFSNYSYFLKFFGAAILYNIIVGVGLVLLILPGIYLGIRLQFFAYLIVDKDMGPIEALKKSWEMTEGKVLDLFLLGLVIVGLNILGFLALLIGMAVTAPITMVVYATVYKGIVADSVESIEEVVAA